MLPAKLSQECQGRSSRPEVFYKKSVLRNFAKFTEKHLCQSLFFNTVWVRRSTLFKKRLWHSCFPVNFAKFLRKPFCCRTLPVARSEISKNHRMIPERQHQNGLPVCLEALYSIAVPKDFSVFCSC